VISGRRFRLVPLFVFVMLALLSCPEPIDQDLLRLVKDTITVEFDDDCSGHCKV
jgi:hypothetical protein